MPIVRADPWGERYSRDGEDCKPRFIRLTRLLTLTSLQVADRLKKATAAHIKRSREEVKEWETEVKRLDDLNVVIAECEKLKNIELPALEKQIKAKEAELPAASEAAQEASVAHTFLS